ncbi:hypothetical protein DBB34_18890 [Sphaerisporangium cinnabarinum]|nr:DUF6270 domain-containing protein [Sphaerisporangium cinnabarinum]PTU54499.1 hypothetical protein DBB34_18890 [Sphaerisporangium cinnabarinum]
MTHGSSSPQRSVLVHGSCVTRDAFALPGETRFRLADYYARSSLASAFAAGGLDGVDLARVESSFQRRMVERDQAKTFATKLVTTDADVVLLDLVDEQYDLVVGSDGGVATRSMEFLRAGGDGAEGTRVASGAPEFLVRWEAGWATLVRSALQHDRLARVIVHEAYWARGDAAGRAFDQQRVESANRTLTYLYARMRKDLPEARFLRVPDRLVVGDPSHRWGASPVHYVEGYYRAFLDLLDEATRADV